MKKICIFLVIFLFAFTTLALAENFKVKSVPDKSISVGEVEYVKGEILVKFKEGVSKQQMADLNSALGSAVLSDHRGGVKRLSVPAGKAEQEFISLLQSDPRVEYAELNTICHAFMTPNDPYYSYQWHFPKINCSTAWDISTGSGVVVGILDCGIAYEDYPVPSYELNTVRSGVTNYMQAPDLAGTAFTAGYDFANGDSHPNDNNGHGTHVAGTVAQTTNDGYGVAGVAFNCTLMPVKVLDYTGSGTANWLADGLYWAADHGAEVINMSMGWPAGYNPGSTVQNAIVYAYNHGVVLVAASGNQGVGTISYPAKYSQVIAVGATRYDDGLSYYSQYGAEQEVVAPGGDLTVDQNGDGYGDGVLQQTFENYDPGPPEVLADPTTFSWWFFHGTSMSCPHVVAVVAMMIANGQTGIENIRTILQQTAVDLGSSGWDQYYGYGLVDAYAALTYGGVPPVAEFSGSPLSGCVPLTVNFTDESTGEIDTWEWNFGDGSPHSYVQNPSHEYTSGGDFTVSLTVTNAYGSDTETKTNYIHVDEAPVAAFVGNPTTGCAPLTVDFTDQSTGAVTSWDWDFGDGTPHSSLQNPTHEYANAGDYTVTLTVSGPCGSDDEIKTNYISVGATLIAEFSGSPTSGCATLTVNFTDQSTGDITSWDWDFGDGTPHSGNQNPTHQYTSAGDYTVTLTVTGSCGSDDEIKTNYIHVDAAPVAAFYGNPTSGDVPLTVNFYDQSTGAVTSWDWDFGDGTPHSSAQNPVHEYTSKGLYTVTLTVSGPCGSDGETKTDYINVTEGGDWIVITYDDFESGWGSYSDGGGDCSRYTRGTYAHQGNAALDIQDNSGVASSFYHTVGYDVSGYTELEVEFWFYAVSMESGEDFWVQYYDGSTWRTVATFARGTDFNNNAFYNPVVTISSSQYNFPTNAKLRFMCDASGNSDDVYIDEIEFRGSGTGVPAPVASFSASPTSGCAPLTVNFTDESTGDITAWDWNFGDGTPHSGDQNPSHQYANPGDYTVTLTVTGPGGSDDEVKSNYIHAEGPPVADFYGDPTSGTVPLTVNFHDQSTGTVTSWDWDFGDGTPHSSNQNPVHEYSSVGLYTVTLTVTGPCGSDGETKTDYINVTPPGEWTVITYDDFESGWGSYSDGGGDCSRYTRGTYAHQGNAALDIQDNSGVASSFYHTVGYNVSGYTELEVEFWFYAVSMESGEDFWVQYYDGSTWRTVATYARGTDFNNNTFYNPVVTISSSQYNFPANAQLRFMCDASGNRDDVYLDEIEFRGSATGGASTLTKTNAMIPEEFTVSQNYPNPFNPVTQFTLDLIEQTQVSVVVYNVAGQKVRTLVNEVLPAGSRTITWDGTNDSGEILSSGVYFYRVVAGDNVVTKKMMLLK
jgi:PKD repeat protein